MVHQKRKLIIDTDIGLDDTTAIAYLTQCKDVDVLALTLVSGNASMEIISQYAKKVLSFIGCENIKLYESGSYNLLGQYIESHGYYGADGYAGIELPSAIKKVKTETGMTSPEALVHYASKYPGELHLLCIGPFTNLALAFMLDNKFPSKLASISVMGTGASEESIESVTSFAEFNAHSDPVSYKLVNACFQALPKPITIVAWVVCMKSLLPFELFEKLNNARGKKSSHNKALELFCTVTDRSNQYIQQSYLEGGFVSADLLLAVGFAFPEIYKSRKRVSMEMEIVGEKAGHCTYRDDKNGVFELITEIDVPATVERIIKTFLEE